MSTSLHSVIPDPQALLSLEPEELAGSVLECLNSCSPGDGALNRFNFTSPYSFHEYPAQYQKQISEAVTEAWVWLEREGLIAPRPQSQGEWIFVTRRGKQVADRIGLDAYRKSSILPRQMLHPAIVQKVWSAFIRGEYDTAVFGAFKEVEVAVRSAGKFGPGDIGTELMRKAFHKSTGPLTDGLRPEPEREATAHLFAGAIGLYKNPHSHRNEIITDPVEAVEMIILASHLLRIVDSRSEGSEDGKP